MYKLLCLFSCILLFTGSACFIDINDDDGNGLFGCVDGDGPLITETLNIASFDELVVRMPVTVHLVQGDVQEVVVDGKPNIISQLRRNVHNGVWEIDTDDCVRDLGPMTFFITVTDLDRIKVTGSGNVISDAFLEVNDITLDVSGSGNLNLALLADDITATVSGSGDIFLEGEADDFDLRVSGSGDLRAFNLLVNTCHVTVSGAGDAEVNVADLLEGRISGSGDVYFKGNPTLDVNVSGSGDLVDAN